jgi:hypothetical protein
MKFIRKGTGRPFPKGQFIDKDLSAGALPGVRTRHLFGDPPTAVLKMKVEVRSGSPDSAPYRLSNFQGWANNNVAAGLDPHGRPSFITIEETGDFPNCGISVYSFSEKSENHIEKYDLSQSENYVSDLIKEYFVAQWSLVSPRARKGLRRTSALYELTAAYALSSYRSEGLIHVCLGVPLGVPGRFAAQSA